MIAIGRYFVFTISVTATILSAHQFEENDLKDFLNEIKLLHNQHRSKHWVPKLDLDETLSKTANEVLNKLHGEKSKIDPKKLGVNMAKVPLTENSKLDDEEAARLFAAWYDTGAGYNYKKEPSEAVARKAAPFTQIVWMETKTIGLAMSVEPTHYDIVVIYSPEGNKKKKYRDNVFTPKD